MNKVKEKSTRRVRLHRQKMKDDGFKSVYVSITPEHKEILDKLCKNLKISQASLISYLLDCALDQTLPQIDKPFS
jgi:DNA-binding MarR family transcriptional regulator